MFMKDCMWAEIFFTKQDEEHKIMLVDPQINQVQMIVETVQARLSDLQREEAKGLRNHLG